MLIKEVKGKHFLELADAYYLNNFIRKTRITKDTSLDDCIELMKESEGSARFENLSIRSSYSSTKNTFISWSEVDFEKIIDAGVYELTDAVFDAISRRYTNDPQKMYELYLKAFEVLYKNHKWRGRYKRTKIEYNVRLLGGAIEEKASVSFVCAAISFVRKHNLKLGNEPTLVSYALDQVKYWSDKTLEANDKINKFFYKNCRESLLKRSKRSGSHLLGDFGRNLNNEMMFEILETDSNSLGVLCKGRSINRFTLRDLAETNIEKTKTLVASYFNQEYMSKPMDDFIKAVEMLKNSLYSWYNSKVWDDFQDFALDLDPKLQGYFIACDLN